MSSSTDLDYIYKLTTVAKQLLHLCKESYELHNIVERFILSNVASSTSEFYKHTDETLDKFNSELADKNLSEYSQTILDIMNTVPTITLAEPVINFSPTTGVIQYRKFKTSIPIKRAQHLSQYNTNDIVLAAMKYYCLLPRGQQWAVPIERYSEYVAAGATVEGFASPFNSQIVFLGSYNYCSMFPTDTTLGSLGDFFSADLSGKTIVVNPPFIEKILAAAAKRILELISDESNPSRAIFIGPWWPDSEFFTMLSSYPHQRQKPSEHHYTDPSGKTVRTKFSSVEFKIGF